MSYRSFFVQIVNETNETLYSVDVEPKHGYWVARPPNTIPPQRSAMVQVDSMPGAWIGPECTFKYVVHSAVSKSDISCVQVYASCPFDQYGYDNEANVEAPVPKSIYICSWKGSVDNTTWIPNAVPKKGATMHLECKFQYERTRKYKFRLVNIAAKTDHPVRNSRKKLIRPSAEQRVIWDSNKNDDFRDSNKGSFQPNVFAYDFGTVISSSFVVTFQAVDEELVGARCFLYGTIRTDRVFKSTFVEIHKVNTDISVTVYLTRPTSSSHPFAWNADVTWGMELTKSTWVAECLKPDTSRLEFYWVAKTIHDAFQHGIPVGFLRIALPSGRSTVASKQPLPEGDADPPWHETATNNVFNNYNKIYDTISGAPAFGVFPWGGIFNLNYYLAAGPSGVEGTLYPYVNCMDQAAALELTIGLSEPKGSWLVQQPFGYIHTTHLVGVVNQYNQPLDVNNPFFGTNRLRAVVDRNDAQRSSFYMHVYNGHSKPFQRGVDLIYDACGGPHLGTEIDTGYLDATIDRTTTLYVTANPPSQFGTPANIAEGAGVTGINGQYNVFPAPLVRIPELYRKPPSNLLTLSAIDDPAGPKSYRHWAHVPNWIKHVLDDQWDVAFGQVSAGDSTSNAFWHLGHAEEDGLPAEADGLHLKVNIHTETQTGDEGVLDINRSASAARDRLESILMSTDRNPEDLWVRGTLNEFGEYSLQYAEHIPAGRIIIVSGNVLVDISGASSSAALETYARQLLEHTVVKDRPPLRMAAVRCPFLETSEYTHGRAGSTGSSTSRTVVNAVGTEFYVRFELDSSIVAASAHVEGAGILVDDYVLEEVSENHSAVIFTFVSQELGSHNVNVHFADSLTLISTTKKVEVVVVNNENGGGV